MSAVPRFVPIRPHTPRRHGTSHPPLASSDGVAHARSQPTGANRSGFIGRFAAFRDGRGRWGDEDNEAPVAHGCLAFDKYSARWRPSSAVSRPEAARPAAVSKPVEPSSLAPKPPRGLSFQLYLSREQRGRSGRQAFFAPHSSESTASSTSKPPKPSGTSEQPNEDNRAGTRHPLASVEDVAATTADAAGAAAAVAIALPTTASMAGSSTVYRVRGFTMEKVVGRAGSNGTVGASSRDGDDFWGKFGCGGSADWFDRPKPPVVPFSLPSYDISHGVALVSPRAPSASFAPPQTDRSPASRPSTAPPRNRASTANADKATCRLMPGETSGAHRGTFANWSDHIDAAVRRRVRGVDLRHCARRQETSAHAADAAICGAVAPRYAAVDKEQRTTAFGAAPGRPDRSGVAYFSNMALTPSYRLVQKNAPTPFLGPGPSCRGDSGRSPSRDRGGRGGAGSSPARSVTPRHKVGNDSAMTAPGLSLSGSLGLGMATAAPRASGARVLSRPVLHGEPPLGAAGATGRCGSPPRPQGDDLLHPRIARHIFM